MKNKFFPNKTALITLVAACFVVNVTMGVRQTFGLFSGDFEIDCGISNTEFGLAIALHALIWGIVTPIFGRFADKHGGSKMVIFTLIVYGVGVLALGNNFNTGTWFQINLGLLVGIGLGGAAGTILAPVVTKHFPNHSRGKAAGYVTAFGGLGMFIFPVLTKYLMVEVGWQSTFTVFAIILFIMCIPGLFLKKPEGDKENLDLETDNKTNDSVFKVLKESFAHKGFRLLVLGFFVCGFQITLVATHVPRYVQDRGLEDWTGFAILSLIGLFNIIGVLIMGYLSDKYSKKMLLSGLYFFRAISIMLFIFLPPSNISAIAFGVTFGLLWLATVPATNGIVAQVFGAKNLSMLFGIVFLNHQIGSFLGAYLGGVFYDTFGNYDYAWYLAILLSFVATLLHLPIDEKPIRKEATI
ncbi:MAG: MFS transporter [Candidatus Marinimicrobia bacterium]|nr:MFS transporter [Candidatus Neomarinimicrobiota bacterium]|tara:strand:+ start:4352 stop:5584 length:1233 start_codon:yes stop_codon:yes gene_type:complete